MSDTANLSGEVLKAQKKSKVSFSHVLKNIVEFKGWEFVFKALLIGFGIWGVYNLGLIYTLHTSEEYAHVPKFSIYDFKLSFVFVLGFFLYKRLVEFVFFGPLKNCLDPEKFPTEEDKIERAKKACKWVNSIIYYSASTLICYYLFHDEFFFPTMLGGNSTCSNIFMYTPGAPPTIPNGRIFYMLQFGCHLHTLIDHVVYKWSDPKFWEMFLHHGVAVFLIFFSYMTGEIAVGILVLFTHDPGDIFLDLVRLYNDYRYRKTPIVATIYATFMFVWIFFRLYAFPKCIVGNALDVFNSRTDWGIYKSPYAYLMMMLVSLVALHIYWFFFIIRIAINIITKKKEFNSYDKKKNG